MTFAGFETMDAAAIDRRHRDAALRSSTMFRGPGPFGHADPILTPLFTSLWASAGVTGSIFGVSTASFLGSLTTAIVTTAVTTGLQMLLAPKPPKPEDGKVPLTQAMPPRIWVVGRTRLAGSYMLFEAVGSTLLSVQALAGHPITSVNRYWLHDDEVTVASDGA